MRFKGLDLNLLVALDGLLETRSVSRAADRLNLSQPAMSAALSRLRQYFGDEILVMSGKRMYLTAFAESLLPELRECLRLVDGLVSGATTFNPATSHRTFSIIASDYVTIAAVTPMIVALASTAPGVRIELRAPDDDAQQALADGKVDLLITPDSFVHPDHPAELLFEERHVIAGWDGNPVFDGDVTEAGFFEAGHVAVAFGRTSTAAFADRQLSLMGKARRIEVVASAFTTVPWLLLGTTRLCLMHERLAKAMAAHFPIATAAIPFEFPVMREMVQFHQARSRDDGLRWLREQVRAAGGQR